MFIRPTGPIQGMHEHTNLTFSMRQAQTMANEAPFEAITILSLDFLTYFWWKTQLSLIIAFQNELDIVESKLHFPLPASYTISIPLSHPHPPTYIVSLSFT